MVIDSVTSLVHNVFCNDDNSITKPFCQLGNVVVVMKKVSITNW